VIHRLSERKNKKTKNLILSELPTPAAPEFLFCDPTSETQQMDSSRGSITGYTGSRVLPLPHEKKTIPSTLHPCFDFAFGKKTDNSWLLELSAKGEGVGKG
jgi:hypothetical protein